jgi:hypothetical protein
MVRRALLPVLLLALASCAVSETDRPRVEARACFEAGVEVVSAWTAVRGLMPARCVDLLDRASIHVVDELPETCGANTPDGKRTVGCAFGMPRAEIYLLRMGEAQTVDIAAHEWVHVIASCVDEDVDSDHSDARIWGGDLESVLGLAQASAPIGPCL